jgi:hypothetical protein
MDDARKSPIQEHATQTPLEQHTLHVQKSGKKKMLFALGVVSAIGSLAIVGYAFWGENVTGEKNTTDEKQNNTSIHVTPTGNTNITDNSMEWNMQDALFTKSSLDKSLAVEIYGTNIPPEEAETCLLKVKTSDGNELPVADLLDTSIISCSYGMGSFSSDFQGWITGNRIILYGGAGTLYVIDPVKKKKEIIGYDQNKYRFIAVNRDANRWLFEVLDVKNELRYEVLDENKQILKDDIRFTLPTDGYNVIHYDPVNDLFLFVTERIDEKATERAKEEYSNGLFVTKFDMLEAKNLIFKNLLTTDPAPLYGRGCYPEELASVPGVVIIKGNGAGCILLENKYREANGDLHLPISD